MRTVGLPLRADRRISYLLEAFCIFCLPKPTQKVALVILFLKRRVHDPILHLDRVFPVASTFCPQRKALFALPQILSPASCFTICCCDDGFSEEHVHFALSGEQAKSKALPLPLDSRSHLSGPIYCANVAFPSAIFFGQSPSNFNRFLTRCLGFRDLSEIFTH